MVAEHVCKDEWCISKRSLNYIIYFSDQFSFNSWMVDLNLAVDFDDDIVFLLI